MASKAFQPHPPLLVPNMRNEDTKMWATYIGLVKLINQDQASFSNPQGVKEIIQSNIIILLGRKPLEFNIEVAYNALGLLQTSKLEASKSLFFFEEVPRKVAMQQMHTLQISTKNPNCSFACKMCHLWARLKIYYFFF